MGLANARLRDRTPGRTGTIEGRASADAEVGRLTRGSIEPAPTADIVRTLAGSIAVATIVGCALSLTIALVAVRLDLQGFSARAIGLNTAAAGVATLATAPFIAAVARRIGVAVLLLASLLLGAVALVGFSLTNDYNAWLLLRLAEGVAVTVMFVLSEFWITSAAPADRRSLAIGIYVTSLAIGFAVGPLILVVVGTAGSLPFYLGAALFAGAAVPLALNAKTAPMLEEHGGKGTLAVLRESPVATLAPMLHGAIEVAGMSLLPVYALQAGLDAGDGALLAAVFILGNSALQLPIGFLADKVDRDKLLFGLSIVGAVGAAILASAGAGDKIAFGVGLFAWGGVVGTFYPIGLAQLGARYNGSDLASANAACVMTYAIGMLAGPPLIGAGLDLIPPAGFFWATGLLILLYVASIGTRLSRATRRTKD